MAVTGITRESLSRDVDEYLKRMGLPPFKRRTQAEIDAIEPCYENEEDDASQALRPDNIDWSVADWYDEQCPLDESVVRRLGGRKVCQPT
jgi:hypothetical protein